jgi:chromatin segregation and condensation protein Rec8/ScpA/Scc1 (kleisin family)/nucleoside-diphosphate-sugar epimerase
MAANLIYLKSRSLLPVDQQPPEEDADEDDPRWDLIRQLIEYKKFKEAAAQLQVRQLEQEGIFVRQAGAIDLPMMAPLRLGEVGIFQLINAFQNVIKRIDARENLTEIFGEHYTVSDKIEWILQRVGDGVPLRFSELFVAMASRVEIVVTFLALLELIRLRQIRASQQNPFEEIEISASPREAIRRAMPRILIAGCGYVGSATADLFLKNGWEVEGWTASAETAERLGNSAGYPVRAVDVTDPAAVDRAASGFDAVIQSASSRGGGADAYRQIYLRAAHNLAAAFPDALHLFTSSTSVYAQTSGEWVTEESAATPARETGRVLRETEEFVLGRGGIVVRLAGIYGPGRSALLRKFLESSAVLDPAADRFVNQAHRDDIAAALLLLVQQRCGGEIYNVADHHPISQRACYEWLAAHLRRPLPPVTDRWWSGNVAPQTNASAARSCRRSAGRRNILRSERRWSEASSRRLGCSCANLAGIRTA